MIEILKGFPNSVVAVAATGRVTKADYDAVLIPKVKEALSRHAKIRCYYEIGSQFSGMDPGAVWEDFRLGIDNLLRWERVAVVTDVDWIRVAVNVFRFLVPGEIRVFRMLEVTEARLWVVSD